MQPGRGGACGPIHGPVGPASDMCRPSADPLSGLAHVCTAARCDESGGVDVTFINGATDCLRRVICPSVDRLSAADVLKIPHLAHLPPAAAERLAGQLRVRNYQPRELIAVEGEPCPGFFQLLDGRARLFRTGPEGREQIMRMLHAGDTFGEVAVFDGGPIPATIETLETSSAVLVPSAVFRALIDENPVVAVDLLGHFAAGSDPSPSLSSKSASRPCSSGLRATSTWPPGKRGARPRPGSWCHATSRCRTWPHLSAACAKW